MKKFFLYSFLFILSLTSFVGADSLKTAPFSFVAKKQTAYSLHHDSETSLPIIEVNENNLEQLIESPYPVILKVYTDWCPPCQRLKKVFHALHEKLGDRYQFATLDAEKEKTIARNFDIYAFPTVLFIEDQTEIARHVGYMNEEKFLEEIALHFSQ